LVSNQLEAMQLQFCYLATDPGSMQHCCLGRPGISHAPVLQQACCKQHCCHCGILVQRHTLVECSTAVWSTPEYTSTHLCCACCQGWWQWCLRQVACEQRADPLRVHCQCLDDAAPALRQTTDA
jgi:hypothetical protein